MPPQSWYKLDDKNRIYKKNKEMSQLITNSSPIDSLEKY